MEMTVVAIIKPGEKVEIHPIASLFPAMAADELVDLTKDVAEHGVRRPVVFWGGKLIDGRHRLQAAVAAGLACPRVDLDIEDDPVAFVVSENLQRRHLTVSQRAIMATKLIGLAPGSNQYRKLTERSVEKSQEKQTTTEGVLINTPTKEVVSVAQAAKSVGVSVDSVNRAKRVVANVSPELVQAVEEGKMSLNAAAKIATEAKKKSSNEPPKAESNGAPGKTGGPAKAQQTGQGDEAKKRLQNTKKLIMSHLNSAMRLSEDVRDEGDPKHKAAWSEAFQAIRAAVGAASKAQV